LPVPVFFTRFFAARFVFIFGIAPSVLMTPSASTR
jgi:hypothetical protein